VKATVIAGAIVAALVLQTTLGRFVMHGRVAIDLTLIAVVYVSLMFGPTTGLLAGALAGLAQDALSGGLIGVNGMADTLVGFLAGTMGTQLIVTQPFPRFMMFAAATVVHTVVTTSLYVLLDLRPFELPYASVAGKAAANAVVGVVVFQFAELLPGAVDRRRAQRARIRR
jgi:rod shape-determining protein MreD